MQLTVAICTYNPDGAIMLRVLDALMPQLAALPAAELLVIDNNSSPPLADQAYFDGYPIRFIREPKPGLTAAREAAITNARGDLIVFVDDDNILDERYLETVLSTFSSRPSLGLLGGRVVPEYEADPPEWFGEFEPWLAVRRHAPDLYVETTSPPLSEYFPIGAGLAVRRCIALAYIEDCAATSRIEGRRGSALSSREDLDLGLFTLSCGDKLAVTGALSVIHVIASGRTSIEYLERLAVSNVKSSSELETKWGARLGTSVHPMFSMSLPTLLVRAAATSVLSLCSPRHKIKRRVYMALSRARLEWQSSDARA